ncbi:MAG: F0F1 ATP synthase subunit delta [Clostridiales bacterium]|nr:F0F1 ATP synthase subunit delta [Clostridiales bacterium]
MKKPVLMIAPSVDERTIRLICDEFTALFNEPFDFDVIRDEKLIGGFIAMIDGKVYDTSFSSRLNGICRQMTQ